MQFAKDSFFLALQERLAALNPVRSVTLNGATVPAVVVVENLTPTSAEAQPNTFYLEWGAAQVLKGYTGAGALMSLEAAISYYTVGSVESMVDRGRMLAELDAELLAICQPPCTEKRDYTRSPSADLGTAVSWDQPSFQEGSGRAEPAGENRGAGSHGSEGRRNFGIERRARIRIYFFSEVTIS